jgi:hypothetical protein
MQEMFMGNVPDFNTVMQRLTKLEEQIHKTERFGAVHVS